MQNLLETIKLIWLSFIKLLWKLWVVVLIVPIIIRLLIRRLNSLINSLVKWREKKQTKEIEVNIDRNLKKGLNAHKSLYGPGKRRLSINLYDLVMNIGTIKTCRSKPTKRNKFTDFSYVLNRIKPSRELKINIHPDPEIQKRISEEIGLGIAISITDSLYTIKRSTLGKIIGTGTRPDIHCFSKIDKEIVIEAKGTINEATRKKQIKKALIQKTKKKANIRIASCSLLNESVVADCHYIDPRFEPSEDSTWGKRVLKTDHYARIFNLMGQSELSKYFNLMRQRLIYDRDFPGYNRKQKLFNKILKGYTKINYDKYSFLGRIDMLKEKIYQFIGIDRNLVFLAGFLDFDDYEASVDFFLGKNRFHVFKDGVCIGIIKDLKSLPARYREEILEKELRGEIKHFQEYISIIDIDRINEISLIDYFYYLFKKLGCRIKREQRMGDIAYDLIVEYKDKKFLVEIKRSRRDLNLKDLSRIRYDKDKFHKVILITNSKFPQNLIKIMQDKKIIIIDRENLKKILRVNDYLLEFLR